MSIKEDKMKKDKVTAEGAAECQEEERDFADGAADEPAEAGSGAEPPEQEAAGEQKEDEALSIKYMRLAADFQNYKKRTEKERFERYTDGKRDFAADLLAVVDNFERAVAQSDVAEKAAESSDAGFLEGMRMILKQLQDVLSKNGIAEIEALGLDFDPNLHHAVVMEKTDAYESGKVSAVLQKGYIVGENKVIRPAMVKVAE